MVQYDVKRVTKGSENFMVSFDFAKTPITQVADYIIIAASKSGTSDIHFDPRDEGMMVRFRIDGDCQDYTFIPKAYERNLTTRLKLLANMNITETRLPQDGAIKGQFGDTYLDMRVACLPTNQGEKIVIRILDYTRSLQGIDSLGFHPKNLEKIHHMMGVPNGIILVTGATGSGKSTTTYSMLSALNKPEVNVITVEDPVEMNIEGINQVQVNAEIGMTFAAALRSILREDPNVILIGEIRDSETAQIAVRASITGHLVMSTLHTNNALATVERLLDMDVERYLLSTALTGIISQRLAKQLCPDCRVQREPTKYEKKIYKKFLHQDVSLVWDANPKGCDNCRKGYKGRIAVHEVLLLDDKIRNALNNEKMSKDDFAKMIYSGNTISMLQDALIKSLEGQTSFEEVYKTIEIENEDEDNYQEELEGITINQVTEEEHEEEKTEEDYMGEDNTQGNLTAKYDIPGITTSEEVQEQPQETETSQEVQVEEQVQAESQEEPVYEEPEIVQETQVEEPVYQEVEITQDIPTEEAVQTDIQQVEQTYQEEPTEEIQIMEAPSIEQPVETYETQITEVPTEQPEISDEVQVEEQMGYKIVMPEGEADNDPIITEQSVEQNSDQEAETYNIPTPTETTEGETYENNPETEVNEYELPQVSDEQQEQQLEEPMGYKIVMPEGEADNDPPQVEQTISENVEITDETSESEFTMPEVSETPITESNQIIEAASEIPFEMSQVNMVQSEEQNPEQTESQETPTEETMGYKIVMPEGEADNGLTQEIPSEVEEEHQESEQTEENNFEMPTVTSDDSNTSITSLDNMLEEVTDDDNDDDEEEETVPEKYTISARQEDKEQVSNDNTTDDSLTPIIDDDSDEDEENDDESEEYQKTNNNYYEEDAIDPTIDIKTDLDQLVMPSTPLEKLDMSEENNNEEKQEPITEEQPQESNNNEDTSVTTPPVEQQEPTTEEQTQKSTNDENNSVVIPSIEQPEPTTEEQTQENNNDENNSVVIPSIEQQEPTTEEQTQENTNEENNSVVIPSIEQQEPTTDEQPQESTNEENNSVVIPSIEQPESTTEEQPEQTSNEESQEASIFSGTPLEETSEDDYEYDYEYDDYDFDNKENDYTEEEQLFFNKETSIDDNNANEDLIQNIQASSVISDVLEEPPKEEHTGSNILSDPGIRIAEDGSINQGANINADPILPNYDE